MTDLEDFADFMKTRKAASDAFVDGDASLLQKISAADDPATLFGPKGDCVQGAAHVVATNDQGAKHFGPGGHNEFDVQHMAASEGLAYWVGIQRSVVNIRGENSATPMALRVTEIFRRDKGSWKLVHRHADKLAAS